MAGTVIQPFQAIGDTVNNQFSTTNEVLALTVPSYPVNGFQVRVYNSDGTNALFIKFGTSISTTATTAAGMPIPPGTVETFTVDNNITHVAGISAAGTPTVYFTSGGGA